ncbi:hypothetical protein [Virgibacillus sp. DJP39]
MEEEKAQLSRIGKLTASDFLIMLVGVLSIGLVTIILWMIM